MSPNHHLTGQGAGSARGAGGTGAATVATDPVVVRGKIDSTYMLPQGGSADRRRALQGTSITDTGPNQRQQDIEQRRRDIAQKHQDAAQKLEPTRPARPRR